MHIGIAGAGLLGRLLAWQACQAGHRVSVFDPAADAQPRFDGQGAAGFSAAGMLSPLAELDGASTQVARWGLRSLALWPGIVANLPQAPFFAQRGSLLVAHRSDLSAAQRVLSRLAQAPADMPRAEVLSAPALRALEPALHGVAHAWLLPGEGQIDPIGTLRALHAQSLAGGVVWHWNSSVRRVAPGRLWVNDATTPERFDGVFDVRGLGARALASGEAPLLSAMEAEQTPTAPLRGVRGETAWLHAPGHGLTRPVRLLHPRLRVYVVPRPNDTVVVGASEIESEDRGAVSLRSAVELMSAAYSILPALAEARIVQLDANLRPAYPDNEPQVHTEPGLVRINGLFRHGWLLAPALIERALAEAGWSGLAGVPVAQTMVSSSEAVSATAALAASAALPSFSPSEQVLSP
ncbi:MAG: FAD-dependent oxidoreductase [Pseudomonadota bacterium]